LGVVILPLFLKKSNKLEQNFYITASCIIENNQVFFDDSLVFEDVDKNSFGDFSKLVYKHFAISYPKFFKMDALSKLAFLASEIILKDVVNPNQENDIALVFANSVSSLDTDVKYQESIQDKSNYFPSPAVFVYTLPNICLGEISIKHALQTENAFFVLEDFSADFLVHYAQALLATNKAEKVLLAWTEYFQEEYKVFACLIAKEGTKKGTIENINSLYNS